jgi:hypothetical protein
MGMAKGPNSLTATVGGLVPAVFEATVNADVLLELGHSYEITLLRIDSSRVLSLDTSGHWALWGYASRSLLANGDSLSAELAGPTVVIELPSGFEVRAASDGHVLSTITAQSSWWKLSSDGSYLCAGSDTGLSAWTPTGRLLISHAGDYSNVMSFAAPGQIRVALGPKGTSVVETIDVQTGVSTVGPAFAGRFHSWFTDGERFLTNVANTVWVYSKASLQEAFFSLSTIKNLTGQGGWLWTHQYPFSGPLDIYAVGGSGTPAATYPIYGSPVTPSGTTIGVGSVSVIDLSGSSPSKTDYILPIPRLSAYGATSSSQWIVGNQDGIVLDGASLSSEARYFGLGRAWSIAGGTDRVAVAIASGKILYFDAATNTSEGSIDYLEAISSWIKLGMSNDGTVLAAWAWFKSGGDSDTTLNVFSLPSGSVVRSWPYATGYPLLTDCSLSGSGVYIGQEVVTNDTGLDRQVSAISGGPPTWSDSIAVDWWSIPVPIRLSADGSLIAVSNGGFIPSTGTNIFKDGILATAVTGWAVGWIDDARLLVNHYRASASGMSSGYYECVIYDPAGLEVAAPSLPEINSFQTVTVDTVYSPEKNRIFSLSTGAVTWKGINSTGVGAVAGSRVVFASGSRVLSEPY